MQFISQLDSFLCHHALRTLVHGLKGVILHLLGKIGSKDSKAVF